MSDLNSNIATLQDKVYSVNFDISKSFLPDKEVVKNQLLLKNPLMKTKDAQIMVDGFTSKIGPTGSVPGTPSAGATSSGVKDISKTEAKKLYGGVYPLPKTHHYYDEAKKTKKEVREAAMGLIKEQKALVQDLIVTAIKIGNAVPAITLLIAPLSFNVPGAISLLLLIIDAINLLINKIMDIVKLLEPLTKLGLLIDKSKFESVTAPLNAAILIIIALFEPISILKLIIEFLLGQLKKTIKDAPQQNATPGASYSIPPPTKDGNFDESNVGYAINIIKTAAPSLTIIKDLSDQIALGKEVYVYNVELPNGVNLTDIDDDALQTIKEKYKLIFKSEPDETLT